MTAELSKFTTNSPFYCTS